MRIAIAALLAASSALCQPAAPPSFDVASIKLSTTGRAGSGGGNPMGHADMLGLNVQTTPDSVTMRRITLKGCIEWAYHVFEYQVTGPGYIDSDRYDIVAKSAGPATQAELRLMLQTLLADRFQLTLHRQTKEEQAYILTVGKNGPKFKVSTTEGESDIQPDQKTMSVKVQRVPMSSLIDPLSRIFQAPVVDMTGLKGRYDVSINVGKFVPQGGDRVDPLTMIQGVLQEELGLKLEPKKVPLDLLIVDHAAKAPTGN